MPAPRPALPPLAGENHACAECPLSYPDISVAAAVETIRGLPAAVAVGGFVDCRPGGELSYRELLVAVAVRPGAGAGMIGATVTGVWVDSPAAQAGGRALWSLPKELAEFHVSSGPERSLSARDSRGPLAAATFRRRAGLPVRVPVRLTVVQERGGSVQRTPARASGLPAHASARWTFEPDGPLGYLHGLRPSWSVLVSDLRMRFGRC